MDNQERKRLQRQAAKAKDAEWYGPVTLLVNGDLHEVHVRRIPLGLDYYATYIENGTRQVSTVDYTTVHRAIDRQFQLS